MIKCDKRAVSFADRQFLGLFVNVPTDIASLRRREVPVYHHHLLAFPLSLIGEHGNIKLTSFAM